MLRISDNAENAFIYNPFVFTCDPLPLLDDLEYTMKSDENA